MECEIQSIIPNTTQIPHLIIRKWMPLLSDVELRILLVVADQTLGWIVTKQRMKNWKTPSSQKVSAVSVAVRQI